MLKNIIRPLRLVRNFTVTPLYTAKATAVGGGRNGAVKSSDGLLDLKLAVPKGMGGPGGSGNTNPEQLFAAGYSACFLGAVHAVAPKFKVKVPENATVDAAVHIGKGEGGKGFLLAVDLKLTMPGVSNLQIQNVLQDAHVLCPYSCATRGNIKVNLIVGQDEMLQGEGQ
jgi:lipoyl-dependent peroxiredoxin